MKGGYFGICLMFLAAACWMAYILMLKPVNEKYDTVTSLSGMYIAGILSCMPVVATGLPHAEQFTFLSVLVLILSAIVDIVLCNFLYIYAVKNLSVTTVAAFENVLPVVTCLGTLLGSWYLLEHTQEGIRGAIFGGPAMSARIFAEDCKRLISEMPDEHRDAIFAAMATGEYSGEAYEAADAYFYKEHVYRLDEVLDYILEGREKKSWTTYMTMWGPSEFMPLGRLKDYDVVDRLKEIHIPCLYTCGEYDECTPEASKIYADATPGAELVVIKDGSHMHHVEKPEEFKEALDTWLAKYD